MRTIKPDKHITRMKITDQYLLKYGWKNIQQNASKPSLPTYKKEAYIMTKWDLPQNKSLVQKPQNQLI